MATIRLIWARLSLFHFYLINYSVKILKSMNKKNFGNLRYSDFQSMALDPSLSLSEKIGFPDQYREGHELEIYRDIRSKLTNLEKPNSLVLDIGPGCSILPKLLIEDCEKLNQSIFLIDSKEMLSHLPDSKNIHKVIGPYPDCYNSLIEWQQKCDVILCYSVLHYIFTEQNFWQFLDYSLKLLAPGGQMLIGDIPNVSKRKRFFSSDNGIKFHQKFTASAEVPLVDFMAVEDGKIDDAVMLGIIMRIRTQGFDAYWVPQSQNLPMANRREDILIFKP